MSTPALDSAEVLRRAEARNIPIPTCDPEFLRRFWANVQKSDGCWEWTGPLKPKGYACMVYHARRYLMGRASWEIANGKALGGFHACHTCDNPGCVNPNHLEPVTNYQNVVERGVGESARNKRKTHCKRGHEFTPENTWSDRGWRLCRRCKLDSLKISQPLVRARRRALISPSEKETGRG